MRSWGYSFGVLLLVGAAPQAWGQEERPHHEAQEPQMRQRMERMHQMRQHVEPMVHVRAYAPPHLLERREVLELSDEQVSRLEAFAAELEEAHGAAQAEAESHHAQLMELWEADAPDVDQLRAHAEAAMEAQHRAHLAVLTAAAQAKGLLTAEQRGRVAGWLDGCQMMMHQRMQQMHGRMQMMQGMHGRMEGMEGHMERMQCCMEEHRETDPEHRQ
jgi:hypothetical protein